MALEMIFFIELEYFFIKKHNIEQNSKILNENFFLFVLERNSNECL